MDLTPIDWSAGFFGVRSPVRSALTASARQAHPHTRLLIIGDTPFDGIAAKAAGIPFLAVCTGKYDRSAFQDSDAVAMIGTLAALISAASLFALTSPALQPMTTWQPSAAKAQAISAPMPREPSVTRTTFSINLSFSIIRLSRLALGLSPQDSYLGSLQSSAWPMLDI